MAILDSRVRLELEVLVSTVAPLSLYIPLEWRIHRHPLTHLLFVPLYPSHGACLTDAVAPFSGTPSPQEENLVLISVP